MRVVCIRHLPTAWNRVNRLQGRRDTDILEPDDISTAAIRRNQETLQKAGHFDLVLVSNLKRTQQTARIYGFKDFRVEPLLDELDFGDYEGRDRAFLLEEIPDWTDDPRNVALGEPVLHLEARIRCFVEKYSHLQQVLVFGHGSWTRGLLSIARYADVRNMNALHIDNNELMMVDIGQCAATTNPV